MASAACSDDDEDEGEEAVAEPTHKRKPGTVPDLRWGKEVTAPLARSPTAPAPGTVPAAIEKIERSSKGATLPAPKRKVVGKGDPSSSEESEEEEGEADENLESAGKLIFLL